MIRDGHIGPLAGIVSTAVLAASTLWLPEIAGAANDAVQSQGKVEQAPTRTLDNFNDISAAFQACWLAPPLEQARSGMRITIIVSFTRTGEVNGEPRFSYMTPEATAAQRAAYQRAVAETLSRCTPLHFTPGLGNAVAGRPFAFTFVDERTPKSRSTDAEIGRET